MVVVVGKVVVVVVVVVAGGDAGRGGCGIIGDVMRGLEYPKRFSMSSSASVVGGGGR